MDRVSRNVSCRFTNHVSFAGFVLIVLCWAVYLKLVFQGALFREVWFKIGSLERSLARIQDMHEVNQGVYAALRGWSGVRFNSWEYRGTIAGKGEAFTYGHEVGLLPLQALHEEFFASRATLFVLTFRQAGNAEMDRLFSTGMGIGECQPNMRVLEWLDEEWCNRLFNLLHSAIYNPAECTGLTGWYDPEWDMLDCIPWIVSYSYKDNYRTLPMPMRSRLKRIFQGSRIISGHFLYGIHSIGHRGTFAYVTSLRDPVSRVVSWWNWSLQRGKLRARIPLTANATFDEFVWNADFPIGGFQKSNHMTRVLCNHGTGVEEGRNASGMLLEEDTPLELLTEVTQEHYECALNNLQNFVLVFVAERIREMEHMAPLISRLFNMKLSEGSSSSEADIDPARFNEHVGMVTRSRLASATLAKLVELNKWDALLYEKACTLHNLSVSRLQDMEWGWLLDDEGSRLEE